MHPQIVLADEPTGALDSRSARSLMEQLSGVNREDEAAVLMVTHDAQAASFCSRILFIQDGKYFMNYGSESGRRQIREFYERILSVMAQLEEEAIMFSELIRRNSKRNRQENTLYFVTMILTVTAFYIILALDHQDVMIFLKEMERDAVNKLLMLIPILYVVSLCLLYFLVYFNG